MNDLKDRVVIITGASSGIGAATALCLASAGLRVMLAARRLDRLEQLRAEIDEAGGMAVAIQTDVTDRASIIRLVDLTLKEFGRVDVLVNNAGVGRMGWLEQIDPADVRLSYATNVLGTIDLTQAVLPIMIAQRRGHIINVNSVAGKIATPTYSIYASTKFAIDGFAQSLRREVSMWGIHVSMLHLGSVATEFETGAGIRRRTNLKMPDRLVLSAEAAARTVLSVIRRPRSSMVRPRAMLLTIWINRFAPWLIDAVTARWAQIERSDELRN
jgi:hypothetical protein